MIHALLLTTFLSAGMPAQAERYAVLISANRGEAGEAPLRFAASDAAQLAGILENLGGFEEDHMWTLRQPSAGDVRQAFAAVGRRMAADRAAHKQSMLVVYYAGHTDALSLHLGAERLMWPQLIGYTRGTGAQARVLVVDACRGNGAEAGSSSIASAAGDGMNGLAIFASVSPDERSRESDAAGGAIFSHHLMAALQGVGDTNGDGKVSLAEALQYSAERTTPGYEAPIGGDSLANFRLRLNGNAELALTEPARVASLAALHLGAPGTYVIRQHDRQGTITTQAVVSHSLRTLWLPAGRYFVQRREGRWSYEGAVTLLAQGGVILDDSTLSASDAEASKPAPQGDSRQHATLLTLGAGVGASFSHKYRAPLTVDTLISQRYGKIIWDAQIQFDQAASAQPRGAMCGGSLAFGARAAADSGPLTLSLGLRAGALILQQPHVATLMGVPHLDAVVAADVFFNQNVFAGVEGVMRGMLLPQSLVEHSRFAVQPGAGVHVGFLF